MTEEIWKPVLGYEGRYEVSDQGRVRNAQGRMLKPNRMVHNYTCVHLYKGGKSSRNVSTIHRLVASAFLENPLGLREVNHKNFDRADNRAVNLEWVSRKENVRHAVKNGRRPITTKRVKGIHLKTGVIVSFQSMVYAEIHIVGKQTGGISHALRENRPAYGYVWWLA
jgi:hypothetical protein